MVRSGAVTASSLPPGRQVQLWDSVAAHEPIPGRDEVKGVGGDGGDASVVTDDPGQGRPGQGVPLTPAEHAWILVPQPARLKHGERTEIRGENDAAFGGLLRSRSHSPVSLADFLELGGDEAGKQRTHAAITDERLGHAGQPHVDVVGGAVQRQQPAGQVGVVQDLAQLPQVSGLRQAAELAPRVVALVAQRGSERLRLWTGDGRKGGGRVLYLANRGHAPSACSESPSPALCAARTGTASPSERSPSCGLGCSASRDAQPSHAAKSQFHLETQRLGS